MKTASSELYISVVDKSISPLSAALLHDTLNSFRTRISELETTVLEQQTALANKGNFLLHIWEYNFRTDSLY